MSLYSRIARPALFRLDPERAHHLTLQMLSALGRTAFLLKVLFGKPPASPARNVCGIAFRNPVGLAAGMDKNAVALRAWEALGFGFVEIGTVTAVPQPGNQRPRLFRYPAHRALINRMGFNNHGAATIADRLRIQKDSGRWPAIPVGVNIGKSKCTPLDEAPSDYLLSYARLLPYADYFVINVSSPNTPGLRALQDRDALERILTKLLEHDDSKPLFVKIAPDLSDEAIREVGDLVNETKAAGIVATNTTLDHSALTEGEDQPGGLSGAPLRQRAAAVIRELSVRTRKPIIASGGIMNAASARERVDIGAALVQIYTGFVYSGPPLIREICHALDS